MKLTKLFFFFAIAPLVAMPQQTNTISEQDVEQQIVRSGPSEDSPFVIERAEAQQALANAATNGISRSLPPRKSFQKQACSFFGHLTRTFQAISKSKLPTTQLLIEPSTFSVNDTSEINVTFKINNSKKEILMLHFSTNQRIDIFIKNAQGVVLGRWSEDRAFDQTPGLVAINPEESVVYTEAMPTSMMKDGETYTIEASLVGQPGYTVSEKITPNIDVLDEGSDLKEQR